jgi:pimeloyl-ACP methyl ester carboxylesterase
MNYFKCGLSILAGLLLAGCGGNNYNPNPRGNLIGAPTVIGSTLTTAQLDATTAKYGYQDLAGTAKCDVTVAQINYQTPGVQLGEMTNASAAVYIPSGANCPGPFPLVAFSRATNLEKAHTMADYTSPDAVLVMTFFAAQGYAVVATDYLGYALSSYPYHPYLHADSEASSVIDSIRAARQAASSLGLTLNGKVMVTGYSQGGHTSMATQRAIERENSGEFNLVAAAHLAGPYYISANLVAGVKNPVQNVQSLVPFQITAYQRVYGNVYDKVSDVFKSPYDGYIERLFPSFLPSAVLDSMLPTGTPPEAQAAIFKSTFLTDLADNTSNGTYVAGKKQDLLGWNPKAPTTLCGGSGDPCVKFLINAQPTFDDFRSRGGANVSLVDVDAKIQQKYGSVDPATYTSLYHGQYEPPFCLQVAKELFDQYK